MFEITPIQKKVLVLFSKSSLKDKFYWTGGTLLSTLYLHHRYSKDLDFFSEKPINFDQVSRFITNLKRQLKLTKVERKKIFDRWEFFLHDKENLRAEFVFYDHPKIKSRKRWQGVLIDSLEDIAANKVLTLFDRNDPKDLVDLYFLLTKKRYKPKTLLKLVERKFGVELEESSFWSECCKGLEDLDEVSPLLTANTSKEKRGIIKEIRNYFISQSADYLKKILK